MAGRSRTRARRVARGNYNFTYKRRAQLHRAAIISAEKRRKHRIKTAVGVVAGLTAVGAAAYLGHKHGPAAVAAVSKYKPQMANIRNRVAARIAVAPNNRQLTPHGVPIVGGAGPIKRVATPITAADRAKAEAGRAELAKPRADKRIYHEDGSVNTEAMTERSVKQTTRRGRKRKGAKPKVVSSTKSVLSMSESEMKSLVAGKKTPSLQGTPGGTRKPVKAIKKPAGVHGGLTEDQWASALAFDEGPKRVANISSTSGSKTTINPVTGEVSHKHG